jgi:tRNA G18 (ribose-2'-O)-methylase SpoU
MKKIETAIIIHDVRSAHNVGAMFRTAEAAGIFKIFLTGYTPAPFGRFGRPRSDVAKAALGAEKLVPWEIKKSLSALISKLKQEKYQVIALEQSPKSIDYKKISAKGGPASGGKKFALMVGNEVAGLPKSILDKCDKIAEIKMRGEKESLNVSVALGIAVFRILNL